MSIYPDRGAVLPAQIDLIWNHTYVCTQPCADCCVSAVHVVSENGNARLRDFVGIDTAVPMAKGETRYQAAQKHLQAIGRELSYSDKLRVLEHLAGFSCRIDLSGGDALVTPEGLALLEAVSARVGRDNLTLTITGAGLKPVLVDRVAPLIGEFNFTFNAATPGDAHTRPAGYADINLQLARRFRAAGVRVRAECPLTSGNCDPEHLRRLYLALTDAGVEMLLLMRQFNVGRGSLKPDVIPTREDYVAAIRAMREAERTSAGPRLKLQCALRHLENPGGQARGEPNPCDLGTRSYGLMPNGVLLASPWAYNKMGGPLNQAWVLGNLARTPLREILLTPKAQSIIRRAGENYGHCKIHAALASTQPEALERMFDRSDPLYTATAADTVAGAAA
jgi:MoaA/NifB/PqqE/SkfB family radical SAM enzyme